MTRAYGPVVVSDVPRAVAGAADVAALDIPALARVHGTLHAFGFSLAGLLGWLARNATTA